MPAVMKFFKVLIAKYEKFGSIFFFHTREPIDEVLELPSDAIFVNRVVQVMPEVFHEFRVCNFASFVY